MARNCRWVARATSRRSSSLFSVPRRRFCDATCRAASLCNRCRHSVAVRGLRSTADRKCAGAVARSVLRCRPSGFPAVHHIREALAPLVQNLILYAYPGPGLRLAEPAAFHSSTGCRPGAGGSANPAARSSCVPRGDLAKDRPAALSPEAVTTLGKSRASGSPPLIPKHGPAFLWQPAAALKRAGSQVAMPRTLPHVPAIAQLGEYLGEMVNG